MKVENDELVNKIDPLRNYTLHEAAELIGRKYDTMHKAYKREILTGRKARGSVLVDGVELIRYVKSGRIRGPRETSEASSA